MGVAQSGQVVGKIGETFGVSNLALDTEGVGDSSQVVVSGYVLPGLQVKYGVGIFDSLATLTLRYRLMPRLYVEAVSGIDLYSSYAEFTARRDTRLGIPCTDAFQRRL